MKYLKYFEQASAYEAYKASSDYVTPNVSYVVETEGVSYEKFNPFLDVSNVRCGAIYIANSLGDKQYVKSVDNIPEGYTPIGVVINRVFVSSTETTSTYCMKILSLKYMSSNTPDTGSIDKSNSYLKWFTYYDRRDVPNISNDTRSKESGKTNTNYILNNTWNDGWKTEPDLKYNCIYPAAMACWRYSTIGTTQGDWFLPSKDDWSDAVKYTSKAWSDALQALADAGYSCAPFDSTIPYWTSSEKDSESKKYCTISYSSYYSTSIGTYNGDAERYVRAMMDVNETFNN
jgi:hypothetical protein